MNRRTSRLIMTVTLIGIIVLVAILTFTANA